MSLKFFFNRKAKFPLILNFLGLGLMGVQGFHLYHGEFKSTVLQFCFIWICILVAFFFLFRFITWYSKEERGFGIEEHFENMMVLTAYSTLVVGISLFLFSNPWPLLVLCALVLSFFFSVDLVLIYFYLRDKDVTPPSYFTKNLS